MTILMNRSLFSIFLLGPPAGVGVLAFMGMDPSLALTIAVLGLIVTLTLLEWRRPFREAWSVQPRGETLTDVMYIALASVPDRLTRLAIEALALAALGAAAVQPPSRPWVQTLLYALAAFVLADFGKYLIHRTSHTVPWLWRFHLAHHQPSRVSALNALRLHPVNMAYNAAIDTVPLLILGISPAVAAVLAALRATVGVLQHANLELEQGDQWLVNAPSYHRVHHHADAHHAHHNFGSTLLVWDRWFGTLKRAPAPHHVGVAPAQHRRPVGYVGQLFYPWCGSTLYTRCWLSKVPWLIR